MSYQTHAIIHVEFIHSDFLPETLDSQEEVDLVGLFQVSSDQLDMEIKVTESAELGNNLFDITIWNTPSDMELVAGDQILWRIYWEEDPDGFALYSGIVETVVRTSDNDDYKLTVQGTLISDYVLRGIRPIMVPNSQTAHIIKSISDFEAAVSHVGVKFVFVNIPVIETTAELPNFIKLGDKTVYELMNDMAEIIGTVVEQDVIVRYRNFDQSISFKLSEDADVNIGGAIIHELSDRSVYEYAEELSDSDGTLRIQVKTAGLPGFTYSEVFEFNDEFYISDDVVHTYSVDAGYLTEIYAHRFVEA